MTESLSTFTQLTEDHPNALEHRGSLQQESPESQILPLNLIIKLCQSLEAEKITYCHWKSNNALDRSARGENDLDLLVSRDDISRFLGVLYRLEFKQAMGPKEKQAIGAMHFYGYDESEDQIVHIHAHTQLFVGHDFTKNLRLPIEQPFLESVSKGKIFRVPATEFEFIVFVIRMALKHFTWDAVLGGYSNLKDSERRELEYLQARIDSNHVMRLLAQHMPYVNIRVFNQCIEALQPASSKLIRIKTGQKLQHSFQAIILRSIWAEIVVRLWRRITLALRRRFFKMPSKHNLENGGIMIAMLGGDGAGKSTAVDELYKWLSENFNTAKTHLGKPTWTWTTIVVRGILKIGRVIGLYSAESSIDETLKQKPLISKVLSIMLREVCRAHDRYLTYLRAQRFAANGGIVILDRFPIPQIQLMDGPISKRLFNPLSNETYSKQYRSLASTNRFVKKLVKLEQSYYERMSLPDIVIVLSINPEIAVQRRPGENACEIRMRSQEILDIDWQQTSAYVIDASQPKTEVIRKLKSLVWSKL